MRKSIKKLALSRETIGALDQEALGAAVGMSTVPGCLSGGCPSAPACSAYTNCVTVCFACGTAADCLKTYTC